MFPKNYVHNEIRFSSQKLDILKILWNLDIFLATFLLNKLLMIKDIVMLP